MLEKPLEVDLGQVSDEGLSRLGTDDVKSGVITMSLETGQLLLDLDVLATWVKS